MGNRLSCWDHEVGQEGTQQQVTYDLQKITQMCPHCYFDFIKLDKRTYIFSNSDVKEHEEFLHLEKNKQLSKRRHIHSIKLN